MSKYECECGCPEGAAGRDQVDELRAKLADAERRAASLRDAAAKYIAAWNNLDVPGDEGDALLVALGEAVRDTGAAADAFVARAHDGAPDAVSFADDAKKLLNGCSRCWEDSEVAARIRALAPLGGPNQEGAQ